MELSIPRSGGPEASNHADPSSRSVVGYVMRGAPRGIRTELFQVGNLTEAAGPREVVA